MKCIVCYFLVFSSVHCKQNESDSLKGLKNVDDRTFTTNYEYELVEKLFKDYDKKVRPARNYSEPITVYVDPIIYSLIEVDEQEESLKIIEWRNVGWKDHFLQWNPADFGGVSRVVVPSSEVWTPDIIIFNTITREEELIPVELNVQIYSSGVVTWCLNEVLTVRCNYEILWFPFDTQNCTLQYGTWTYPSRYIQLATSNKKSYTIHGNSEWEIVAFHGQKKTEKFQVKFRGQPIATDDFDEIHYHLVFKRKPTYYIFVLLIPTFIIATISILGLFSPFSSGMERSEKVNLGLTTLLTMAIMLQIVADAVPRTREGLPLLGIYVMYEFFVSSVGVCVTVIIMYLHHRALQRNWKPPKWLLCITFIKAKRYRRLSNSKPPRKTALKPFYDHEENFIDFETRAVNQKFQNDVLTNLRVCTEHITSIKEMLQERERSHCHEETWSRIFDKFDNFLLIFFMVGNICLTIGVFSVVIFGYHK